MSPKLYLQKLLSINVPMKVTYQGFKDKYPATDFVTKQEIPGKFQYLHLFSSAEFPDIARYANEYEHQDLLAFKPGDRLTVCKMEKKREGKPSFFNHVYALEGDVMQSVVNAAPPSTPTQTRKLDQAVDAQKEKDTRISLQGFMQQLLPVMYQAVPGAPDDEIVQHALILAEKAYLALQERAKSIASKS